MEVEIIVTTMIFIDRLITLSHIHLNQSNLFPLLTVAIIISTKVTLDTKTCIDDFLELLPFYDLKEVAQMEQLFLKQVDFCLAIKPSIYTKYCIELVSQAPQKEPRQSQQSLTVVLKKLRIQRSQNNDNYFIQRSSSDVSVARKKGKEKASSDVG
eukprot:TRINITY_DN8664_c0_g2_i3.p1 TRINITY_DN8664_c0_g2~~TRINITY_DN8664_c0_g2_i3.p1  ORF type:complete len:155 (+),score=26.55 TRINITY_DN8664_c0_g2_i3:470-934(+)